MTKFGIPFSGAADEDIGGQEAARKGDPFPMDQVDESRKGALRGDSKTDKSYGHIEMESTGVATDGFMIMKKMESF